MAGLPKGAVERVLVVVAHPDDAEFWAGGTIAAWTDAGIEVTYCVLTDGEAGGFDPGVPRGEIPGIRRAEQREAAALLGVGEVGFLGLTEGGVPEWGRRLHEDLVRVIRRVRPQRVLTWSPEWNWQRFRSSHPAHLATGAAVLAAIYPDASNPFALAHLKDDEPPRRSASKRGKEQPVRVTEDGVPIQDLIEVIKQAIKTASISSTDADRDLRVSSVHLTLQAMATVARHST